MCLTKRCSMCQKDEQEIPMIDWEKPIEVKDFQPQRVTKVGMTTDGLVIIESYSGSLYRADPTTGNLSLIGGSKVTNVEEPWEEAWESSKDRYYYVDGKEYFKYVFELGRSWKSPS